MHRGHVYLEGSAAQMAQRGAEVEANDNSGEGEVVMEGLAGSDGIGFSGTGGSVLTPAPDVISL